jgi:hypothetical protein
MNGSGKVWGRDANGDRIVRPASSWYEDRVRVYFGDTKPAPKPAPVGLDPPMQFTGERGTLTAIQPDFVTRDGSIVGDAKHRDSGHDTFPGNAAGSIEKLWVWNEKEGTDPNAELALVYTQPIPRKEQNKITSQFAKWLRTQGLDSNQIEAVLQRVRFYHVLPTEPPR